MKRKLLLAVIFVLLLSCKTASENISINYNATADGWLNRPVDNEFYYSESINIPIIFVNNEKVNEAIMSLNDVFYKELTNEEYEYFTGKINDEKYNVFLIRSVNYTFSETGYRIYRSDKNYLLISHSTLSNARGNGIKKLPIIILYNDMLTINEIYTNYSVVR